MTPKLRRKVNPKKPHFHGRGKDDVQLSWLTVCGRPFVFTAGMTYNDAVAEFGITLESAEILYIGPGEQVHAGLTDAFVMQVKHGVSPLAEGESSEATLVLRINPIALEGGKSKFRPPMTFGVAETIDSAESI